MERPTLFKVPPGAVADVKIIDTTSKITNLEAGYLMEPPIPGFSHFPELPSWSFLIESGNSRKALFDLGVPKDWRKMAPASIGHVDQLGWRVGVDHNVSDILQQNDYKLDSIDSIIWSHWHWDHVGDPSTFPASTELVVGPGFKRNFMPGYPTKPDAPLRDSDFRDREVREIDFENHEDLQIGDFRAIDFWGDGSFYLLDTPGHAIGHLCGLVRTTSNPDTFIFMGGDLCHHGAEMRPSEYVQIPKDLTPNPFTRALQPPCPGATFEKIQRARGMGLTEPFCNPAMGLDIPEAIQSIRKAQKADAEDTVLFIYAHDTTVRGAVELFPKKANDWQNRGCREKMFWAFLGDFEEAFNQQS
ncbi:hypothetical protein N7474_003080 [Penicillium riverlandense]|uniref:uncharacterized protein n=1 Tax=Penicillium riverlandense TaxID=1903569 RepID=UPI0025483C7D|nr:uncharacterized protein N7474_003080 [Penicillium riverlandense]KAJ5825942.1 hypothetical protein N7474_003080 [Penicillium riverlandense]